MIPIDLITGFLGSGKTTFMVAYANYLVNSGKKVGIIVNDLGAINVDMMLLSSQLGERCALEMITNSPDETTYQRRLKTKLIALGMQGFDRILIEPSGIFDIETFFDVLYEAPLDNWYEIGNVLALVDATLPRNLSASSRYVLASEIVCAGRVILTHLDQIDDSQVEEMLAYLQQCLKEVKCSRQIQTFAMSVPWQSWSNEMWESLLGVGYETPVFIHRKVDAQEIYSSLFYFELKCLPAQLPTILQCLFDDKRFGRVFRVKGFVQDEQQHWYQVNATSHDLMMTPVFKGQAVLIVIGEALNDSEIAKYLKGEA